MAALTLDITAKWFPALGAAPARHVLDTWRLAVEEGETLAVIGPSGCGKTTLLNILAGLDRDFAGRLVNGIGDPLAYVFQEPRLLPWRTVAANLRLVLGEAADAQARIADILAEVGLTEAAEVYAGRLSLGMARRVAIARAFIVRPALLLLDEPFVSLDEPTAYRLRRLLLDLLARHRTTALFVTHSLSEALMLADRVLFLSAAPARPLHLAPVELTASARHDPEAIDACRRRLLATSPDLARLLLPTADPEPTPA